MDGNWNLGVCVLWVFSLDGWKLKSWSLCAMGVFSWWMIIEILEFVCYGCFLFLCPSCASVQLKAALFSPVAMLDTVVQGMQNWPVSGNLKCTQVYAGSEGMSSCSRCVWVCKNMFEKMPMKQKLSTASSSLLFRFIFGHLKNSNTKMFFLYTNADELFMF